MMMTKRLRREEGQDLVEFALILPLLLIVILGLIEFSILFWSYNTIANAAREGARAGIINGMTAAQVEDVIESSAVGLPRQADPASCPSLPCLGYTVQGLPDGSVISVTVTYSTSLISGPMISIVGGDGTIVLRAAASMNRE